jgi:fermentation-respiration switch protein FrsA (DUF1100 family)
MNVNKRDFLVGGVAAVVSTALPERSASASQQSQGQGASPERTDVEFVSDGARISAWLFQQKRNKRAPAIVMAHGWAAVKEMYLDIYASKFAAAGYTVLVFDHRNFGGSEGLPRQEINPHQQIETYRDAISYVQSLPSVDADRIGVWGTSYSGGHVLVLGAIEPRAKCIVSQCPTISGAKNTKSRFPGEKAATLYESFRRDRAQRMKGGLAEVVPFVPGLTLESSSRVDTNISAPVGNDAAKWFSNMDPERLKNWKNETTLKSLDYYAGYEPGSFVPRISVPLLMILGKTDRFTPTEDAVSAFGGASDRKRLEIVDGGHFDLYGVCRDRSIEASISWWNAHL